VRVIAVAVFVFALDRVTKILVETSLPVGGSVDVVGQWVRISHVTNSGAAFGLLPERTTLLSILSVGAVLAIVFYYRRLAADSRLIAATLGMQLGGAAWDGRGGGAAGRDGIQGPRRRGRRGRRAGRRAGTLAPRRGHPGRGAL